MRRHPWRVLTVLIGIALGAAVFTSVRLAVDACLDSFGQSMDLISGKTDWAVIRPGGRVPEGLIVRLWNHRAVEVASPLLTSYVHISKANGEPLLLIGLDPILDRPLRSWHVSSSRSGVTGLWQDLISRPNTILLGNRLARKEGLVSGDTITLEHANQIATFSIIGILEPEGLGLAEAGNVAITDIATMQEFTGLYGLVDRIDIRLSPHSTEEDLNQIRAVLPEGVDLEVPTEMKETAQTMIRAYQLNLSLLSFVSLFVGMFLVYSLVSLNAASRRHELAILRSLGSSLRLIFVLILGEGGLLGLTGWLLALPIGSVLVKFMLGGVSSTINNLFVRVQVERLQLNPWELLLSFLITVAISLLAAHGPAREAIRIAPREALMMESVVSQRGPHSRRWTLYGVILIALSWPISKLPGLPGVPVGGYTAVFVLIAGFYLISPLLLRWLGSSLPPMLRHVGGEGAFLGGRYVRDAGKRTAVPVGALVTAVALFVALTIMVHSFRQTVELWVNQTVSGDLFVRPKMAGLNQYRDPLPPEAVRVLKELPTDALVVPYRTVRLRYRKIPYQLQVTDIDRFLQYGHFILLDGKLDDISGQLAAGEGVLVSEVFANQTGLGWGSHYRVRLGGATLDSPILGVYRDFHTNGGVVYMSLPFFEGVTGQRQWSGARFFFPNRNQDLEGAAVQLRKEILRRCGQRFPMEITSGEELRRDILRIFDETFAITIVLLVIALFVAGLGIATTLTVLVLQRVRHLTTLIALGAGRGQIRSMIFWEAVLMVTTGGVWGGACGFLLSYLLIYVINREAFGWTFLYRVDWSSLLLSIPLILVTALLAALPAVHQVLSFSPATVLREG